MIIEKRIKKFEIDFVRGFADVIEKPYGLIFYNLDNKNSHDSNHAFLFDIENLDDGLLDIVNSYRDLGISPRIYSTLDDNLSKIKNKLLKFNFEISDLDIVYMIHQKELFQEKEETLILKRINALGQDIINNIFDEDEKQYLVKVLERNLLNPDFHLFVGYYKDKPVTFGSLNYSKKYDVCRVDDVKTVEAYQRRGYARELLRHMVKYHYQNIGSVLYLYSDVPTALRIYEEVGFVRFKNFQKWSAWLNH